MNVVIFGKGFGKPRQISLTGRMVAVLAFFASTLLAGGAFVGGYWYSSFNGSGVSLADAGQMASKLEAERVAIAEIRQQAEDKLDALAISIGQMNARVIRLDALGRRLTDMAEISSEEFDFDTAPAGRSAARRNRRWRPGRAPYRRSSVPWRCSVTNWIRAKRS